MPVTVSDVLTRAQTLLQDAGGVRWPLSELSGWTLDGAKEIALKLPSASAVTRILTLTEGTRQTVPTDCQSLMRVTRNMQGDKPGRAVTAAAREMLDVQLPDWHNPDKVPFRAEVRQVIIDVLDPQSFYVYPGNTGGGQIECVLSVIPAFSEEIGAKDPALIASYSMTLPLAAIFLSALVDYVCYRAFAKDAVYGGSADRAQAHLGLFNGAISARAAATLNANPNTTAAQP